MVDFPVRNTLEIDRYEIPIDNLDDATASGSSTAIVFLNFVSLFSFLSNQVQGKLKNPKFKILFAKVHECVLAVYLRFRNMIGCTASSSNTDVYFVWQI